MGKHGDGKGGSEGDRNQSRKECDGRWDKPIPPEPPPEGPSEGQSEPASEPKNDGN